MSDKVKIYRCVSCDFTFRGRENALGRIRPVSLPADDVREYAAMCIECTGTESHTRVDNRIPKRREGA